MFSDDTTGLTMRGKLRLVRGVDGSLSVLLTDGSETIGYGPVQANSFPLTQRTMPPLHCSWGGNKCKITWIENINGFQLPNLADIVFVFSIGIPEGGKDKAKWPPRLCIPVDNCCLLSLWEMNLIPRVLVRQSVALTQKRV